MKKYLFTIILAMVAVLSLNSCFDDNDVVYYDDVVFIQFGITAANEYITTTSSTGADSTYKSTVKVSNYKFYIDQQKHEIYNPDSLPLTTDARHILVSATTKNAGSIYVKSMKSDSVSAFSSTDSIDFSEPRIFYVASHSGKVSQQYTVKVNIHQQHPDSVGWSQVGTSDVLKEYTAGMKAVTVDNNIYVMGSDGSSTFGCLSVVSDGSTWTKLTSSASTPLDADAYRNFVVQDGTFFIKSDGKIYTSADAQQWEEVATTSLKQLLGATATYLYGLGDGGQLMRSADGGQSWEEDEVDGNLDMMPADNINFAFNPLLTNENANQLLLIGTVDDASVKAGRAWGKVEETDEYSDNQPWTFYDVYTGNKYPAPALANMQVVSYDAGYVAIGGAGVGGFEASAFDHIYKTNDGGITWHTDTGLHFPKGFNKSIPFAALAVDGEKRLWVICGESGQVWRGRINRLGWEEIKYIVNE